MRKKVVAGVLALSLGGAAFSYGVIGAAPAGAVPPVPSQSFSSVLAVTTSAAAGSSITVDVTLNDSSDTPISGANVSLAHTALTGVSVSAPNPTTTSASGLAVFTVSSSGSANGLTTLTATDTDSSTTLNEEPVVGFFPPTEVTDSSMTQTVDSVPADGTSSTTVTVTLQDSSGPVVGVPVSIDGGTSVTFQAISPGSVTNSSGVEVLKVEDSTAEVIHLTATDTLNDATITDPIAVSFSPVGEAADSTVVASEPSVPADGTTSAAITVSLRSASGPVPSGDQVQLSQDTLGLASINSGAAGASATMTAGPPEPTGVAAFSISDASAQGVTFSATDLTTGVALTATASVDFLPGPLDQTNSSVTSNPGSVRADGVTASTINVLLEDSKHQPISGKVVTLAATGSAIVATNPQTTSAAGIATFTVTDTTVEDSTISATDVTDSILLTSTATVDFVTGPANPANSSAVVTNPVQAADGSLDTVTLTFKDAQGHLVSGDEVSLSAQNGHSTLTVQGSSPPVTSGPTVGGEIAFSVSDTHAEMVDYTAFDTTSGVTLQNIQVDFVAGGPDANKSTVVASPTSVKATSGTSTITVTALDAHSNPLSGATVTLTPTPSATVTEKVGAITTDTTTTNGAGVATYTVTDSTAQAVQFTASISATVTLTGTGSSTSVEAATPVTMPTVAFTGPTDAAQSAIVATPSSVPADGSSTSTILITLEDVNGNPVAGSTVRLSPGNGSSVITGNGSPGESGPSGANGQVEFTVSDLNVESVVYTATDITDSVTLNSSVTVNFTGQPSTGTSTVVPSVNTLEVGGTVNIVVTLRDRNGNPVSGKTVFVQGLNGVGGSSSASVTTVQGVTDGTGVATFSATDATPETVTFQATDVTDAINFPDSTAQEVVFTSAPTEATTSTVVASPTGVPADGTTISTITVTLTDGSGNPIAISGDNVSLSQGVGTHATIGAGVISLIDPNVISFSVTDLFPESVVLKATDAHSVVLNQQPTVTFTPSASEASNSTVVTSASHVPADATTSATITVTLKDKLNNPVAGDTVLLTASAGSLATITPLTSAPLTSTTATTNGSGVATFSVTDGDAVGQTVTFSASDTTDSIPVIETATVDFTPPPSEASKSTVSVSPPSVPADGVSAATVTVTLKDSSNAPINGDTVSLSPAAANSANVVAVGGIVSGGDGTAGQVLFSVTDSTAETATYNVIDTTVPVTINLQASIVFEQPSTEAANSTVVASPTSVPGDGATTSTVTVTLLNHGSTPVVGANVTLGSSSTNTSIHASAASTNASGIVTFTVTDTVAESVLFTATDTTNTVTISQKPTVLFTAAPTEAQSSTVAASPPTLPNDGVSQATVTVSLNLGIAPLSGHIVHLGVSAGSHAVLNHATSTTGTNGQTTFTVTDLSAEAVTFTVTDTTTSIVLPATPTVTFVVPVPVVSGVSPSAGPIAGGTTVTIAGSGYVVGDTVFFGTTRAIILVLTPSSLEVTSPAESAGQIDVTVVGAGGTSSVSSADRFTYQAPVPAPTSNACMSTLPSGTVVGMATTRDGNGYWITDSSGDVVAEGDAPCYGALTGLALNRPVVGIVADLVTGGYWLVASDGGIFGFNAPFLGSAGSLTLNEPIVGMAPSPSGNGYVMVASDGGVFDYGDAGFFGSMGGQPLNKAIVGIAVTADGGGYWLVGSDGGIFSFGDAQFFGSTGNIALNQPIVGIIADTVTGGYWEIASDGGVFSFDAPFFGSTGGITLNRPIDGGSAIPNGDGYRFVASDGGVFDFGAAVFEGSAVGT